MLDNHMEKALLKIARQLNGYDEASLMSLWERYAEKVRQFEPTRKWEEAALVFSIIQGMRMKNQLFNYHWAQSRKPGETMPDFDFAGITAPQDSPGKSDSDPKVVKGKAKLGKLIKLKPRK